jgi:hypothetical protein
MPFPTVTVTPGSGQTINTLPNAGQATSANSLPVVVASDQSVFPTNLADGVTPSQKATVAQFHNMDNQSPGPSAYGLLTGGVAQLLNTVGSLDRQRETGQNNVPSLGIATGAQQFKSPVSTTLNSAVSAGATSATLTATKFTNNGQPAWIQLGSALVFEFGTANQEAVYVTAVNYGTNVVTIAGLGTGNGFKFAHSSGVAVNTGAYNEAVDATAAEGSGGAGIGLSATSLFNSTLNGGAGGWEYERSANGEIDGASGKGTNVAAEYEFNGGGPVLASGLASGFQFDRARSLQAKGLGSGAITATAAGNTSIVFSSAAATNLIQPGQKIRLRGGAVKETVLATAAWVPGSSATVPIQSPVVNANQTTAEWDVYGTSGPGLNGFLVDGVGIEEEALYDPVSDYFYIERAATQDGMAPQNIVAENPALWNGTTMDRWTGSASRGGDVNVKNVGGSSLVLGQTTMSASVPVAIATNQSNLPTNWAQINGSTISTAAAGVQKVGIAGNAGGAFDAAGQNAPAPGNELIVGGQYNSSPTTITSGNVSPLQLDSSGNLFVNLKVVPTITPPNLIVNPTSTLTRPANTTAYASGELIASSTIAGSIVVPSITVARGSGLGFGIRYARLYTNTTWSSVAVTLRLWSAAPTYANGDGGAYDVTLGSASYLGSYSMTFAAFAGGDGAFAVAQPNGATEIDVMLSSGTAIYWDLAIGGAATPISGQTFTFIPGIIQY